MQIITLTSDMGNSGYYAASVKAAIMKDLPEVSILDITHTVPPFHISSAAFIIRNVYKQFPEGTIHIVTVGGQNGTQKQVIAIKTDNHYFVGPDNGLFSLVFNEPLAEVVEITIPPKPDLLSFTAKDIMAKVAVHIAKGGRLHEIGKEYKNYVRLTAWQPIYDNSSIRTSVVFIDAYGNCIFNLDREIFEKVGRNRRFTIDVKRNPIESISNNYAEVSGGELVAIFNGAGMLEIAINRGNISELLGLKEGDNVLITFEN